MKLSPCCIPCQFNKQAKRCDDENYLKEVRRIIEEREENASSPLLVYRINKLYAQFTGHPAPSYSEEKKKYNDLVLSMEDSIRSRIETSDDPLKTSLFLSRTGNYIDFGAMNSVDCDTFLRLLEQSEISDADLKTYDAFIRQCSSARTFLLVCDNCGEIVLDKLMIEQLKKRFPDLSVKVMVRGGDILNDATEKEAYDVGMDSVAEIISNGKAIGGTVYDYLPEEAKQVLDHSDIILSKGQGNYESLAGEGRHIFYVFLCKCDLFTERFQVKKLTGMFVEENPVRA